MAVFRKFLSLSGWRVVIPVFALCAFCAIAIPPADTHARRLSQEYVSLEQKFIGSSFVFTGIPERSGRDVPMKLTQVYKPPKEGLPDSAQVIVTDDYFDAGREYLIFGSNTQIDDKFYKRPVITTVAGALLTADDRISELRKKKQNPTLFSNGESSVIFIGRVKQTRTWAGTMGDESLLRGIVEIEVLEIFRDAPRKGLLDGIPVEPLHEAGVVKVYMQTCGDALHVNESYLLYARHRASAKAEDPHYSAQCWMSENINQKKILSTLAERHKAP